MCWVYAEFLYLTSRRKFGGEYQQRNNYENFQIGWVQIKLTIKWSGFIFIYHLSIYIILGGSKITADGDCSHEIKRCLLLGRKVMTNLDSILKCRDVTLSTKVCPVKAMVFLVVMYGWELDYNESWALKNWHFWTVVLEKTLENPLDCKEIQPVHPKGDQSWVFIRRTDVDAENFNTLAIWCEELTHLKRPWCWERLRAGGEGDDRGWDGWMASLTQWTWVWVNSGSWWWTGKPGMLQWMGSQRVGHNWATELNWTELIYIHIHIYMGFPDVSDEKTAWNADLGLIPESGRCPIERNLYPL